MLHEFLVENRDKILAGTRRKSDVFSPDVPVVREFEKGLPQFFDHLALELKRSSQRQPVADGLDCADTSTRHGQEMRRLGYSVTQVVHGYGALSRSISGLIATEASPVSAKDLETFGLVLDTAIAEAVGGFARHRSEPPESAQKIGVLAHELRNALAAAIISHEMLQSGLAGDRTNMILARSLDRMREILDRSFSEVRMQNDRNPGLSRVALLDVAEEVEATAGQEALSKGMTLEVAVDPALRVSADPHYLISALSNLVQNAIKYSKPGGIIRVRGLDKGQSACFEVEDECGGLPAGKAEELFQPFTQRSSDRTGLGLGLTISRKAVAMNGGALTVRDLPGKGCVFTITLPKAEAAAPPAI